MAATFPTIHHSIVHAMSYDEMVLKLITLLPLRVSKAIYFTVAVKKCGMKPFSVYSDIDGLFASKDVANEMLTLLHHVFDIDCDPSLPKILKHDSSCTP